MADAPHPPALQPASPAANFRVWREQLVFFDPDNVLPRLLDGVDALLQDRYAWIYERQIELARTSEALKAYLDEPTVTAYREVSVAQFHARLAPRLDRDFHAYTVEFGRNVVRHGGSPHIAIAMLSRGYGECMKLAIERMKGERLTDAMRAMRMLTSIETEILASAMYQEIEEGHAKKLEAQAAAFETTVVARVRSLSAMAKDLQTSSHETAESIRRMREASSVVAAAVDQSSLSMTNAKQSIDALQKTVDRVDDSMAQTLDATRKASTASADADQSASRMSAGGEQIETIVELISGIVDQTKILALNAMIEATRGDNRGEGFTVVAQEIKQLAARTGNATATVRDEIAKVVTTTREAAELLTSIRGNIDLVESRAQTARADLIEQREEIGLITGSIAETLAGAEEILQAVSAIDGVAAEVDDRFAEVDRLFVRTSSELADLHGDVTHYRSLFGPNASIVVPDIASSTTNLTVG